MFPAHNTMLFASVTHIRQLLATSVIPLATASFATTSLTRLELMVSKACTSGEQAAWIVVGLSDCQEQMIFFDLHAAASKSGKSAESPCSLPVTNPLKHDRISQTSRVFEIGLYCPSKEIMSLIHSSSSPTIHVKCE